MDALYRELQGVISQDQIDGGGLRVYTALDPALQQAADNAVNGFLTEIEQKPGYKHPRKADYSDMARTAGEPANYVQGATVVIDNRTSPDGQHIQAICLRRRLFPWHDARNGDQ